ncbi:unnamed protein product [Phytophthora fragariaefolia]|uniref:Unnamed protein product n=1 Tax=Phytophthora fragariaefolia TaxID=1490495 RepID=A0A9W6X0V3_9STRA|nr:unnamed protein product [Phytophthora fragariaefolia]
MRSSITTAPSSNRRLAPGTTRLGRWPSSRVAAVPELTRLNGSTRCERQYDRRDDRCEYRRDDQNIRRKDGRDRRVTVAVNSDDEEGDEVECQPSRRLGQHDYETMRVIMIEEPTPTQKESPTMITSTLDLLMRRVAAGILAKIRLEPRGIRLEL